MRFARHASIAALLLLLCPLPAHAADSIAVENAKVGTTEWKIPRSRAAIQQEIEGYASAPSVNQGQTIRFYVRTTAPSYKMRLFRIGWYGGTGGREVLSVDNLPFVLQPTSTFDDSTGMVKCNWTATYTITAVPPDWTSGVYVAQLTTKPVDNPELNARQSYIIFVVRDDARQSALLFQSSVNTFQAYNAWGGYSLYNYPQTDPKKAAVKVSFDRPYTFSEPNSDILQPGWIPDASGSGRPFSFERGSDFGAGQFFRYEANIVRWLEREGFDVTYSTDVDTDLAPGRLLQHRTVVVAGHDEYWSSGMRDAFEGARDHGVNLAYIGGNISEWQVRYEDSHRTIVEYRQITGAAPPVRGPDLGASDSTTTTSQFRDASVGRSEDQILGVLYNTDYCALMQPGDMVVDAASHWLFAGTAASNGSVIPGVLGYEADQAPNAILPARVRLANSRYHASTATIQPGCGGDEDPNAYSEMSVYTAASGAMVWATGTIYWAWGLDDLNLDDWRSDKPVYPHPTAQRVTRHFFSFVAGKPVADPGGPYTGFVGAPVLFDGAGSSMPGGAVASYSWTFGDGATASGLRPAHSYAAAGTYTVTLQVLATNGALTAATTQVVIRTAPPLFNVVWTNTVNLAVQGSSVTKTSQVNDWDATGQSTQRLLSGNGFAEFSVSETTTNRIYGLSNATESAGYYTIDFGIYAYGGGVFYVIENGALHGPFGNYVAGDRFRIAVTDNVVTYARNGAVFARSLQAPTYPLRVNAAVSIQGGAIAEATIAGNVDTAVSTYDVFWTNTVNVVAAAYTLKKSAGAVDWDASGQSLQTIVSGNGYAEFRAAETTTNRVIGLSNAAEDSSYYHIDFGIYLYANATFYIIENGVLKNQGVPVGSYATGDRFRISVNGGVVSYSKNGQTVLQSAAAPSYPLRLNATISILNGTVDEALMAGDISPAASVDKVIWTNSSNVSIADNSLTKVSGAVDWDAGAQSAQRIVSGDGYAEFTATETTTNRVVGLSADSEAPGYYQIDFGIYLYANATFYVIENGILKNGGAPFASFAAGDRFKISISGGVVSYLRNGVPFYTSLSAPSYPLRLNGVVSMTGGTVNAAIIAGTIAPRLK